MDKTFSELSDILKHGPDSGLPCTIFMNTFDIILSCTQLEEAKPYFTNDFLVYIINFCGRNSIYNNIVLKILINIFSSDELPVYEFISMKNMAPLIQFAVRNILDKNSKDSDLCCMLLSNITRSVPNSKTILNYLNPLSDLLLKLISAFLTVNSNCSLDHLSMFFCNLSQLPEVRRIIVQPDLYILKNLLPFLNHESVVRRRGIIGLFHNCAFDSSVHDWMLSDDLEILPYLLLPLAGPEEFDDEDSEKMPIELQFLPDTKTREPNPEIRKQILETLNQLCATKKGRQYMRDHNVYIILRELHKCEQDPQVIVACENVVDILIRTEDEIGVDHLHNIDIPKQLEEEFSKPTLSGINSK